MYTCDMSLFLRYLFIISSILTVADGGSNDIYEQSQMVLSQIAINWKPYICTEN